MSAILIRIALMLAPLACAPEPAIRVRIPLENAYAHNDYWHKRPLFDALDRGYTHIEVDIFKVRGEFIVAHLFPLFRPGKTLENLYLRPLKQHIEANSGYVYPGYSKPITLMIDIRLNGESTYRSLKKLLAKYRSILTEYNNGTITQRQVTIVLSGSKPWASARSEHNRLVFIDEDLKQIGENNELNSMCPVASCNYGSLLNWNGEGNMPETQRLKLVQLVGTAHRQGKKVRLWASPETTHVWHELLGCGVDLINTDRLAELQTFLLARRNAPEMAPALSYRVPSIAATRK